LADKHLYHNISLIKKKTLKKIKHHEENFDIGLKLTAKHNKFRDSNPVIVSDQLSSLS